MKRYLPYLVLVISTAAAGACGYDAPATATATLSTAAVDSSTAGQEQAIFAFPPPLDRLVEITGRDAGEPYRFQLYRSENTQDIGGTLRGYLRGYGYLHEEVQFENRGGDEVFDGAVVTKDLREIDFAFAPRRGSSPPPQRGVAVTVGGRASEATYRYLPAAYASVDGFVMYYDTLEHEVGGDFTRVLVHLTGEGDANRRINDALWRDYDQQRARPDNLTQLKRTLDADIATKHEENVARQLARSSNVGDGSLYYDAAELYLQTVHYLDDTLLSVGVERILSDEEPPRSELRLMSFDRRTGERLGLPLASLGEARLGRLRAELARMVRRESQRFGVGGQTADPSTLPLDGAARVPGAWVFVIGSALLGQPAGGYFVIPVADEDWR